MPMAIGPRKLLENYHTWGTIGSGMHGEECFTHMFNSFARNTSSPRVAFSGPWPPAPPSPFLRPEDFTLYDSLLQRQQPTEAQVLIHSVRFHVAWECRSEMCGFSVNIRPGCLRRATPFAAHLGNECSVAPGAKTPQISPHARSPNDEFAHSPS